MPRSIAVAMQTGRKTTHNFLNIIGTLLFLVYDKILNGACEIDHAVVGKVNFPITAWCLSFRHCRITSFCVATRCSVGRQKPL